MPASVSDTSFQLRSFNTFMYIVGQLVKEKKNFTFFFFFFFSPVRHSPGGCRRWGWMVRDLHSSLLCTNSFVICIHEPLSLMSAVTLSIHLFRCLPLLRLPSIFVRSAFTGSLSVFILSTCPNHCSLFSCILSTIVSLFVLIQL